MLFLRRDGGGRIGVNWKRKYRVAVKHCLLGAQCHITRDSLLANLFIGRLSEIIKTTEIINRNIYYSHQFQRSKYEDH